MQIEILATHFSLVQLALASALKLPLLGKKTASENVLQRLSYVLLVIACFCLTFSFFFQWHENQILSVSLRELGFVVVFAWLGAFSLTFIRLASFRILVAPLVTTVLGVHLVLDAWRIQEQKGLESVFLACHIAGALSGEVLAVVAAVISFLYLGQHHLLKEKRFVHLMNRLPALDLLDESLIASLGAGFLFLSIALLSGGIFLSYSTADHIPKLTAKLIWALSVWFWYLLALFSRLGLHVSTKTLAQMSLLGFCLLVSAYFGFIF